jgi:hypothetical protein
MSYPPQWIAKWILQLGITPDPRRRRKLTRGRAAPRLLAEPLETRTLLSATQLVNGVLTGRIGDTQAVNQLQTQLADNFHAADETGKAVLSSDATQSDQYTAPAQTANRSQASDSTAPVPGAKTSDNSNAPQRIDGLTGPALEIDQAQVSNPNQDSATITPTDSAQPPGKFNEKAGSEPAVADPGQEPAAHGAQSDGSDFSTKSDAQKPADSSPPDSTKSAVAVGSNSVFTPEEPTSKSSSVSEQPPVDGPTLPSTESSNVRTMSPAALPADRGDTAERGQASGESQAIDPSTSDLRAFLASAATGGRGRLRLASVPSAFIAAANSASPEEMTSVITRSDSTSSEPRLVDSGSSDFEQASASSSTAAVVAGAASTAGGLIPAAIPAFALSLDELIRSRLALSSGMIEKPSVATDLDSLFADLWDDEQMLFPDARPNLDETIFPNGLPNTDEMPFPDSELDPSGSRSAFGITLVPPAVADADATGLAADVPSDARRLVAVEEGTLTAAADSLRPYKILMCLVPCLLIFGVSPVEVRDKLRAVRGTIPRLRSSGH